jgi:hypothetical protein
MPMHMTYDRQLPHFGTGALPGLGCHAPAAQQLGLGVMGRFINPGRLVVVNAPPAAADPSRALYYRLMDPRTLDATRILDAGAPAVQRLVEYAPFPYRPTMAPLPLQQSIAMGGRHVMFIPAGV